MKNIFKNYQLLRGAAAFTLAEVLITLGIIGIVAAVTLPTLIKNYQQYAWNTSAEIFERRLDEALKIMNTDNAIAQNGSTENFVNRLSKYMKIVKTCNNNNLDECFPSKFTSQIIDLDNSSSSADKIFDTNNIKLATDLKQTGNWSTNVMGIVFANGSGAILAYNNKNCESNPYNSLFDGKTCITMVYDTSGTSKPNIYGKDIRGINTKLSGNIKFANKYWNEPFKVTPVKHSECLEMLDQGLVPGCYIKNGAWWIDYDSFWKTGDYWAGAVKKCGGTNNMPSDNDLTILARKLYKDNSIKSWVETTGLTIDQDMAHTLSKNIPFQIWSSGGSDQAAYGYGVTHDIKYDMTSTTGVGNSKTASAPLGICLSE